MLIFSFLIFIHSSANDDILCDSCKDNIKIEFEKILSSTGNLKKLKKKNKYLHKKLLINKLIELINDGKNVDEIKDILLKNNFEKNIIKKELDSNILNKLRSLSIIQMDENLRESVDIIYNKYFDNPIVINERKYSLNEILNIRKSSQTIRLYYDDVSRRPSGVYPKEGLQHNILDKDMLFLWPKN